MVRLVLVVTALALVACKTSDADPKPASTQPTAEAPPPPPPAAPSTGARPMPLLPPGPGAVRSESTGCLVDVVSDDASATRHPEPTVTRGGPAPVVVTATGLGVNVSHTFAHACCLKAATSVVVEGSQVRLTESLSGNPCRCMCGSTIRSAVGLGPGEYELTVLLEQGGSTTTVATEKVAVKRLGE